MILSVGWRDTVVLDSNIPPNVMLTCYLLHLLLITNIAACTPLQSVSSSAIVIW